MSVQEAVSVWPQRHLLRSQELLGSNEHFALVGRVLSGRERESGDVELCVGDRTLRAHSAVLQAHSALMDRILSQQQPPVTLDLTKYRMPHSAVDAALNFMYEGKVNVCLAALQPLLHAAVALEMRELLVILEEYIKQKSQLPSCVVPILNVAFEYPLSFTTRRFLLSQAAQMFHLFRNWARWTNLRGDALLALLSHDDLRAAREADVFEAAVNWLAADRERQTRTDQVLSCIRFGIMPTDQKLFCYKYARSKGLKLDSTLEQRLAEADWHKTCTEARHPSMTNLNDRLRKYSYQHKHEGRDSYFAGETAPLPIFFEQMPQQPHSERTKPRSRSVSSQTSPPDRPRSRREITSQVSTRSVSTTTQDKRAKSVEATPRSRSVSGRAPPPDQQRRSRREAQKVSRRSGSTPSKGRQSKSAGEATPRSRSVSSQPPVPGGTRRGRREVRQTSRRSVTSDKTSKLVQEAEGRDSKQDQEEYPPLPYNSAVITNQPLVTQVTKDERGRSVVRYQMPSPLPSHPTQSANQKSDRFGRTVVAYHSPPSQTSSTGQMNAYEQLPMGNDFKQQKQTFETPKDHQRRVTVDKDKYGRTILYENMDSSQSETSDRSARPADTPKKDARGREMLRTHTPVGADSCSRAELAKYPDLPLRGRFGTKTSSDRSVSPISQSSRSVEPSGKSPIRHRHQATTKPHGPSAGQTKEGQTQVKPKVQQPKTKTPPELIKSEYFFDKQMCRPKSGSGGAGGHKKSGQRKLKPLTLNIRANLRK